MTDRSPTSHPLGADIGGTFTDLVLAAPDGSYTRKKVASTVDDYSRGIVDGLSARNVYGVAIDSATLEVDLATTERLRSTMRPTQEATRDQPR